MTDPLDAKLHYILKSNGAIQRHFDEASERDYETLVPQIKQAFGEAGYIQAPELSGRMFYDRFMKNMAASSKAMPKRLDGVGMVGYMVDSVKDAAKRAAGLAQNGDR